MTQAPVTVAWQPRPHPSAALAALTIKRLPASARAAIARINMVEPSFLTERQLQVPSASSTNGVSNPFVT
jgi:hypothetical protein